MIQYRKLLLFAVCLCASLSTFGQISLNEDQRNLVRQIEATLSDSRGIRTQTYEEGTSFIADSLQYFIAVSNEYDNDGTFPFHVSVYVAADYDETCTREALGAVLDSLNRCLRVKYVPFEYDYLIMAEGYLMGAKPVLRMIDDVAQAFAGRAEIKFRSPAKAREVEETKKGNVKIDLCPGVSLNMIYVQGKDDIEDFWISETELTQRQWNAVMNKGEALAPHGRNEYPVNEITTDKALAYIDALNSLSGKEFDLPTVDQWEYAASGGTLSHGFTYSGGNNPNSVAVIERSPNESFAPVKTRKPNELGIYDMTGNLAEPAWKGVGTKDIVFKGGMFASSPAAVQTAMSLNYVVSQYAGLRLVLKKGGE